MKCSLVSALIVLSMMSGALAQTTATFRSGGTGGTVDNSTRSCYFRFTTSPTSPQAWTTESDSLIVDDVLGYTLVEFPDIVGTGPDRIPPGATIVSATLRLYCTSAAGGIFVPRTVLAGAVSDPDRLGPWHEPGSAGFEQIETGATWHFRDGRAGIQRSWNLAGTGGPSFYTGDPALDPAITVVPANHLPPSQYGTGEYHEWDVTPHVFLWSQGAPNQGFFLRTPDFNSVTYASDDHPNAFQRPALEVVWAPGPPPFNHVPVVNTALPATITLEAGTTHGFVADASDADGDALDYLVVEAPQHGELLSNPPFATYKPEPGFVGTDTFAFVARDAFSTTAIRRITLNVVDSVGSQSTIFQEGVAPAANPSLGACEMAGIHVGVNAERSFEDVRLKVSRDDREIFLSFPNLMGGAPGQVPLGSQILSARLLLDIDNINQAGTGERVLSLARVLDPLDTNASWYEPSAPCPDTGPSPGCEDVGVSFRFRDARQSQRVPWLKESGDVDSRRMTSAFIAADESGGPVKSFDVTSHLQAWSDGEPMHGWRLESSATTSTWFHTDDAIDSSHRPRLEVSWRPATSPSLPATVAPIANAGPDLAVFESELVRLDASATRHPLGAPFTSIWVGPINLGAAASSLRPTFTAPQVSSPMVLDFTFIAFENIFRFSIDTMRVVVMPRPGGVTQATPIPDAGADRSVVELDPVTLTGSVTAPGALSTSVVWTQLEGPHVDVASPSTLAPSFIAPSTTAQGDRLVFELEVTADYPGDFTLTARDYIEVFVQNAPNTPPVPDAGPDVTVEEGRWFILDAGGSTDADGHTLAFTWTQTGGPAVVVDRYVAQGTTTAVRTPFFTPQVPGSAQLTFDVAVNDGEIVRHDTVVVTVETPAPAFSGSLTVNPMAPYRDDLTDSEARHLLRRMGAGWHPDDVAMVRQSGLISTVAFAASLGGQIMPPTIPDEAMNWAEDIASSSNADPVFNQPFDPYPQLNALQMQAYWNVHTFRTSNPLNERLVRFWHDRLASSARPLGIGTRQWAPMHSDMLRARAWGNYRDLLLAFTRDALTLAFIDGFDNLAQAPNENFAREFMELHTLGVFNENGQTIYTELDVTEAAKAFTGWRPACFQVDLLRPGSCYPAFSPFFHNTEVKTVLGFVGDFDDEDMVDIVLQHDGGDDAARFLARNLLEWFVVHEPPPQAVTALAAEILQENWEIAPVIGTLLTSRAMFAPEAHRDLVSSPVEFANGLVRTLRIPLQTTDIASSASQRLTGQMVSLGHELGNPVDVNGWPKDLDWSGELSVLVRERIVEGLLEYAQAPTLPTPGVDFPGYSATPSDPAPFMSPPGTRLSTETLEVLVRKLDIELATTPGTNATMSEFDIVDDFMNVRAASSTSAEYSLVSDPFDGDQSAHAERFWQTVMLLLQHPDAWRF